MFALVAMEGIISKLSRKSKGDLEKEHIHEKCVNFFQEAFLSHWAIGYGESWL